MAQTVLLKRTAVADKVPTTTDLSLGELGLNTHDGRAFIKKNDGVSDSIVELVNNTSLIGAIGNINSPLLDIPLKNSLAMKAGVGSVTFSRSSTAAYIDRYGVLKTAAIDEPRFEKEGYLNEGSSTNLLSWSEVIWDTTKWTVGNDLAAAFTVTNETALASPYGVADSKVAKFVATATPSILFLRKSGLTLSAVDTSASIFIYVPTQSGCTNWSINNDYTDADQTSNYTSTVFDKWVRVKTSKLLTATRSFMDYNIRMNGVAPLSGFTFYAFGAQLETLPFATSYISTTSATATRAADILSVTAGGNLGLHSSEITLIADFDVLGIKQNEYPRTIRLSNSISSGEAIQLLSGYSGLPQSYAYKSPTSSDKYNLSTNTTYRHAFTSVGTGATSIGAFYVNGTAVETKTYANNSFKMDRFYIGSYDGGSHFHYGHITNVRLWDNGLSAFEVFLA